MKKKNREFIVVMKCEYDSDKGLLYTPLIFRDKDKFPKINLSKDIKIYYFQPDKYRYGLITIPKGKQGVKMSV